MSPSQSPPKGLLVALGCAGALVFVIALMFGALYYFGFVQRGGVYDSLRVGLAQSQLNELVPYLELYHAQHTDYPQTLEQVAAIIPANTPVMIQDSSAPPDQPRTYYYERVDAQHYVLRSVGADGIPFTNDDIVPNGYGPGQTGLVLKRPTTRSLMPPASPSEPN